MGLGLSHSTPPFAQRVVQHGISTKPEPHEVTLSWLRLTQKRAYCLKADIEKARFLCTKRLFINAIHVLLAAPFRWIY